MIDCYCWQTLNGWKVAIMLIWCRKTAAAL
jgi:hypothetical protein